MEKPKPKLSKKKAGTMRHLLRDLREKMELMDDEMIDDLIEYYEDDPKEIDNDIMVFSDAKDLIEGFLDAIADDPDKYRVGKEVKTDDEFMREMLRMYEKITTEAASVHSWWLYVRTRAISDGILHATGITDIEDLKVHLEELEGTVAAMKKRNQEEVWKLL